ncbi:ricin-type beta-trefoil lectin domain protein [Streptomyces catenulae]|uniref:Ricin-type beta-trefoil lectin domain protein n=1 Tax=Streptomyces catenulae TaxID=66875 RepID=A0ABV2YYQ3_9ACTN|nr:ricin-type beta-trefoil lectin domain protein [Streptomyces catenulae]
MADGPRTAGRRPRPGPVAVAALLLLLALTLTALLTPTGPAATGDPASARAAPCRRTLVGVAHEDDDLLFVTPQLQHLLAARCPVHTVYLTTGDAGHAAPLNGYVLDREHGVRAAYAQLAGAPNVWRRDDLPVRAARIPSFTLAGRPEVRLTFFGLPDGFPYGEGSAAHHRQSLLKLYRGEERVLHSTDGTRAYTDSSLVDALSALAGKGGTDSFRTLDFDSTRFGAPADPLADHSDHAVAARYFRRAAFAVQARPDVRGYLGYPLSTLPPNLTPEQAVRKTDGFDAYLRGVTCVPLRCPQPHPTGLYRGWLLREYPRTHREPRDGEIMSGIGDTDRRGAVERCLDASAAPAVRTRPCDGSPAQSWRSGPGGRLRPATGQLCLTAAAAPGLAPCDGPPGQTWWTDGRGRIGSGDRCLHQDDMIRPAPTLRLAPCTPYRPELLWRR